MGGLPFQLENGLKAGLSLIHPEFCKRLWRMARFFASLPHSLSTGSLPSGYGDRERIINQARHAREQFVTVA